MFACNEAFGYSVSSKDGGNEEIEEASEGRAVTGSDPEPAVVRTTSGVGTTKLGRMRLSDFEVTAGAAMQLHRF